MKFSKPQLFLIAALLLAVTRAFGQETITNVMSSIVSYQYQEDVGSESLTNGGVQSPILSYEYLEDVGSAALANGGLNSPIVSYQYLENVGLAALTNGGLLSPIISYQYLEWPGDDILSLQSSPNVSYYYPLLDAPVLNIIQTNRSPTTAESTPGYVLLPPTSSQLLAYHGGIFTPNLASVDPNQMTIVLTHGWRDNPNTWPLTMASLLRANGITSPNIVAWDWSAVASSSQTRPGIPAAQTDEQGWDLGEALRQKLGANYSQKIQFIGHSLGTLVNASAANYLQGTNWATEPVSPTPWPATNMLMTLFDEAEVATDLTTFWSDIKMLFDKNDNPFAPKPSYDHPLPRQFAWAENYVSAFGLLQTNAANVILSSNYPAIEPDVVDLYQALTTFHGYPMTYYRGTIGRDDLTMGFEWPLRWTQGDDTLADAPTNGSVYVQAIDGPEYNLIQTTWNFGTNYLAERFYNYQGDILLGLATIDENVVHIAGLVTGLAIQSGENIAWQLTLDTANLVYGGNIRTLSQGPHPNDAGGSNNVPAYAWMQLAVPANALSLSFDYVIQGDWKSDSLAAAFNGTNVLLIAGNEIQTNVTFSSGAIDVSAYAGQTNEFFVGIVGGTSTNAQLTVENLAFAVALPPLLQVRTSSGNVILSWPITAQSFALQTTTNLSNPDWTTLTNVPAIVNFYNTVTNPIAGGQSFYRLISQ